MDKTEIMKRLQEPFLPEEIEWRVDRGQKTANGNYVFVLAYVTNRAIMNRLDEVFGAFGWRNEFKEWKNSSQLCGISVWDGEKNEWVTKWDGSDDSNMDAVKGGISAAMKRTAVQWGIGRYLYNLDQNRVPLQARGDCYTNVKVKANGKDEYIQGYWNIPKLPEWALPKGFTPPPQKPSETPQEQPDTFAQESLNEDLAAIAKASDEIRNGIPSSPPPPQQSTGGSTMGRVYKLREQLNMAWPDLNKFAGTVLGREIKFLKSNVKTEEEWRQIEEALKVAV